MNFVLVVPRRREALQRETISPRQSVMVLSGAELPLVIAGVNWTIEGLKVANEKHQKRKEAKLIARGWTPPGHNNQTPNHCCGATQHHGCPYNQRHQRAAQHSCYSHQTGSPSSWSRQSYGVSPYEPPVPWASFERSIKSAPTTIQTQVDRYFALGGPQTADLILGDELKRISNRVKFEIIVPLGTRAEEVDYIALQTISDVASGEVIKVLWEFHGRIKVTKQQPRLTGQIHLRGYSASFPRDSSSGSLTCEICGEKRSSAFAMTSHKLQKHSRRITGDSDSEDDDPAPVTRRSTTPQSPGNMSTVAVYGGAALTATAAVVFVPGAPLVAAGLGVLYSASAAARWMLTPSTPAVPRVDLMRLRRRA
jgi:hypothetical protein